VLILDLEIEHLARARQRGLEREAAINLLLRQAERTREDEPRPARPARLGPVARFVANLAARV